MRHNGSLSPSRQLGSLGRRSQPPPGDTRGREKTGLWTDPTTFGHRGAPSQNHRRRSAARRFYGHLPARLRSPERDSSTATAPRGIPGERPRPVKVAPIGGWVIERNGCHQFHLPRPFPAIPYPHPVGVTHGLPPGVQPGKHHPVTRAGGVGTPTAEFSRRARDPTGRTGSRTLAGHSRGTAGKLRNPRSDR